MTSKILLGASSKRTTKDLLFDDPSSESTISTMTWAAATSRVWPPGESDGRIFQYNIIGKAISRQKIEYSQAWAICNYSWSFEFSSWSFDLYSSRSLICRFVSQSSRWCFRFASYSLFRVARDSSSRLAIRAFYCSKVFRLSTVLYKAWDFKKDRLTTSCNIQGKTGQTSPITRGRQVAAEDSPWYIWSSIAYSQQASLHCL